MIIIKNSFFSRTIREVKRLIRTYNLKDILSQIAIVLGIIGFFLGNLSENLPTSSACLIALSIVMMSHYMRKYYSEKDKSKEQHKVYEKIHRCSENIREILMGFDNLINDNGQDIEMGSRKWATAYQATFKREATSICQHLQEALNSLGYKVNGVCIKSLDLNKNISVVVARSDQQRVIQDLDDSEKISDNPFVKLLISAHTNYLSQITHKELAKIRRNKQRDNPRFLAIGDIDKQDLPNALVPILNEYARMVKSEEQEDAEVNLIIEKFRNRAKNRYKACLGVMISKQRSQTVNIPNLSKHGQSDSSSLPLELSFCQGFIGVDSTESKAWEFLNPKHVHIIAGVADSLYCALSFYNLALDIQDTAIE